MREFEAEIPDHRFNPFREGEVAAWDVETQTGSIRSWDTETIAFSALGFRRTAFASDVNYADRLALYGGAYRDHPSAPRVYLPPGLEVVFTPDPAKREIVWTPKALFDAEADLLEHRSRIEGFVANTQFVDGAFLSLTFRRDQTRNEIMQGVPHNWMYDYRSVGLRTRDLEGSEQLRRATWSTALPANDLALPVAVDFEIEAQSA